MVLSATFNRLYDGYKLLYRGGVWLYIKPKSCRIDANAFWMYKRFPFPNKGNKRSALLGFIDWLLLRVKLDFFKLQTIRHVGSG